MTNAQPTAQAGATIHIKDWHYSSDDHIYIQQTTETDYIEDAACRNCGSELQPLYRVENVEGQVGATLGLCATCMFSGFIRNLSPEWYDRHFRDQWLSRDARPPDLHASNEAYKWIKDFIPSKGRVLDVGCGNGTQLLCFEQLGYEVTGVEPSRKQTAIARETLKGNVITQPSEEYFAEPRKGGFDVIYFFNVLEFTADPFSLIESALGNLEEDGVLMLHTGQLYAKNPIQCAHLGLHRSYVSAPSLLHFADRNALQLVFLNELPLVAILTRSALPLGILQRKKSKRIASSSFLTKLLSHISGELGLRARGRDFLLRKRYHFYDRKIRMKILEMNPAWKQPAAGSLHALLPLRIVHRGSSLPILLK